MEGLTIVSYEEKGYKPLIDFESWRVALINGSTVYDAAEIASLSAHNETDEIFVLLKGSCMLLVGGNGEEPKDIEKVWLKEGLLYNVTKGTWHNEILMPGSKVLIVENSNTSKANSKQFQLKEKICIK